MSIVLFTYGLLVSCGISVPFVLHDLLDAVQHAAVVVHARYRDMALDLTVRIASVGRVSWRLPREKARSRRLD